MTRAAPPFWPPSVQEIILLSLGVVAVGAALLVVTTRQLVHAALWLVVAFGALAGCYLVLTAEFVAWVQVLIYVGAIVVLLLFGIMLTRAPVGRSTDLDSGNRVVAAVVAVATAAVLVAVVVEGFRTAYADLQPGRGAAQPLGSSIFRAWVLPFEVLSILLLAALIGAIVISRTDIPPDGGSRLDNSGNGRPGDPGGAARRMAPVASNALGVTTAPTALNAPTAQSNPAAPSDPTALVGERPGESPGSSGGARPGTEGG